MFRVGNSNDPATWTTAPAPRRSACATGAGVSGSARVEIVWADGAIKKQWLQVTLKATPNTGLTTADVFYFGNAIGETRNSASDAIVDAIDQGATHNNVPSAAPITSPYDFNRDGLVAAADEAIVVSNTTTQATALQLIVPPELVDRSAARTVADLAVQLGRWRLSSLQQSGPGDDQAGHGAGVCRRAGHDPGRVVLRDRNAAQHRWRLDLVRAQPGLWRYTRHERRHQPAGAGGG